MPSNLESGLAALADNAFFRTAFGDVFMVYYLQLKQAELERFRQYCAETDIDTDGPDVTDWEQNEYYDFF